MSGALYLICGKMGSGKTTISKQLSSKFDAIRICEDEWLMAHYPAQVKTLSDYLKFSNQIKSFVRGLVLDLLKMGRNVVMDYPANTREQRAWLVGLSDDAGATHELTYINASNEKCLSQIASRRAEQPDRDHFDTDEVFHQVTAFFEAPCIEEGLSITEIV